MEAEPADVPESAFWEPALLLTGWPQWVNPPIPFRWEVEIHEWKSLRAP